MDNTKPKLIDIRETIEAFQKMGNAYMIVGGPQELIWGTTDCRTMFIWTSKEKAEDFIKNHNLDPQEEKIVEKPMLELLLEARTSGFTVVRLDFQGKGAHPNQAFVNYRLEGKEILDLLSMPN